MLQIKDIMFRAKTIGTNYWIYGDLINHNDYQMIQPSEKSWPWCDKTKIRFSEQYFINTGTICVSIGKKDISGKPIFTGDILQDKDKVHYSVVLNEIGFRIMNKEYSHLFLTDHLIETLQLIVIGNIFDWLPTKKQHYGLYKHHFSRT